MSFLFKLYSVYYRSIFRQCKDETFFIEDQQIALTINIYCDGVSSTGVLS